MSSPNPQPAPPLDLAQFEGFTPGPWTDGGMVKAGTMSMLDGSVSTMKDVGHCVRLDKRGPTECIVDRGLSSADARLIAAAPALLAECKRQREEIARLRAALGSLLDHHAREARNSESWAISVTTLGIYEAARAALSQPAPEVE